MNFAPPQVLRGDALDICSACPAGCFDFLYCDPPFFTGRKHSRGRHENATFDDRWPSIDAYLAWLGPRIETQARLLKPSATFALHLDWHAVHYAKVLCDRVFGYDNFVNEIIWAFRTGGASKRSLARKHDTILVYAASDDYAFYPQTERSYLSHSYGFSNVTIHHDERGPYREALMRDVWDIPALRGNQPETVGYPTQKPLALIERLLSCFTKPGDTVGDFMCGSGTTAVAAIRGQRNAIVADVSEHAVAVTKQRIAQRSNNENKPVRGRHSGESRNPS